MPVTINNQKYYRTTEVCQIVGISRNTLFRWLKDGNVTEVEHRDYRGWRLFTQAQVDAMKRKTKLVSTIYLKEEALMKSSNPVKLRQFLQSQGEATTS